MKAFVLVIGLATMCLAQVSPDEAMKELEQRKAAREAARAKIVEITAGELADLRAELSLLEQEVADLRAQLAEAKRGNPAILAPAARQPVDPEILKAIRNHELVPGMTLEQAERSIGSKALKLEVGEEGQRVQWVVTRSSDSVRQSQTIYAIFRGGKLVSSTYHTSAAREIPRATVDVGTVSKEKKGR